MVPGFPAAARVRWRRGLVAAWLLPAAACAQSIFYECPGNVFTNTITAKEADTRHCKTREAQQVTTIPAPRSRPVATPAGPAPSGARVDAQEQRDRDTDSRRILEGELGKAQAQLDGLRKEFNNGEPERRGDEKNYQKYLDRVADLKASIARTESDIAAIKRELASTP
jgi:hypothetical protein